MGRKPMDAQEWLETRFGGCLEEVRDYCIDYERTVNAERRELVRDRDAACREAAELRALLMRLSLAGGSLIVRHGPPMQQPQAVAEWWADLRDLLAPPPERAGEER